MGIHEVSNMQNTKREKKCRIKNRKVMKYTKCPACRPQRKERENPAKINVKVLQKLILLEKKVYVNRSWHPAKEPHAGRIYDSTVAPAFSREMGLKI